MLAEKETRRVLVNQHKQDRTRLEETLPQKSPEFIGLVAYQVRQLTRLSQSHTETRLVILEGQKQEFLTVENQIKAEGG